MRLLSGGIVRADREVQAPLSVWIWRNAANAPRGQPISRSTEIQIISNTTCDGSFNEIRGLSTRSLPCLACARAGLCDRASGRGEASISPSPHRQWRHHNVRRCGDPPTVVTTHRGCCSAAAQVAASKSVPRVTPRPHPDPARTTPSWAHPARRPRPRCADGPADQPRSAPRPAPTGRI